MIYDKLNDTLHALPCRIRGLAVSTPQSADDEFLARADLRWATQAEIDAYAVAHRSPTEEERVAALTDDHGEDVAELVGILTDFNLSLPIDPREARTAMVAASTTVAKLRAATVAGNIFQTLHASGVRNDDIVAIATHLQEQA